MIIEQLIQETGCVREQAEKMLKLVNNNYKKAKLILLILNNKLLTYEKENPTCQSETKCNTFKIDCEHINNISHDLTFVNRAKKLKDFLLKEYNITCDDDLITTAIEHYCYDDDILQAALFCTTLYESEQQKYNIIKNNYGTFVNSWDRIKDIDHNCIFYKNKKTGELLGPFFETNVAKTVLKDLQEEKITGTILKDVTNSKLNIKPIFDNNKNEFIALIDKDEILSKNDKNTLVEFITFIFNKKEYHKYDTFNIDKFDIDKSKRLMHTPSPNVYINDSKESKTNDNDSWKDIKDATPDELNKIFKQTVCVVANDNAFPAVCVLANDNALRKLFLSLITKSFPNSELVFEENIENEPNNNVYVVLPSFGGKFTIFLYNKIKSCLNENKPVYYINDDNKLVRIFDINSVKCMSEFENTIAIEKKL